MGQNIKILQETDSCPRKGNRDHCDEQNAGQKTSDTVLGVFTDTEGSPDTEGESVIDSDEDAVDWEAVSDDEYVFPTNNSETANIKLDENEIPDLVESKAGDDDSVYLEHEPIPCHKDMLVMLAAPSGKSFHKIWRYQIMLFTKIVTNFCFEFHCLSKRIIYHSYNNTSDEN